MMDFEAAKKIIEAYDVITIYGHEGPDGDCYGSQLALREMIRDNYPQKKVYAVGSGMPQFFERLSPMDEVDEDIIRSSLAILVDVSCLRRVEDSRVFLAKDFAKFDHHQPNEEREHFDGVSIVDFHRIAAAELLYEMAEYCHWKISRLAAEALYLGICTDSGRFIYRGTTARTMEIIEKLKHRGIRIRSLLAIAYYESPEKKKLKSILRRKAKISGNISYAVISEATCESCGFNALEGVRMVNAIARSFKEANAYALFVTSPSGLILIELRSNKGYPVHEVAKMFNGGGHRYAAGCYIKDGQGTIEDVLAAMNALQGDGDNAEV